MADSVLAEAISHVRPNKSDAGNRSRFVDLRGMSFGLLTVIDRAANKICASGKMISVWNCACKCGGSKTASAKDLRSGAVKSCGCYKKERKRRRNVATRERHGMCGSPTYQSWASAKTRTTDENNRSYPRYGGRGITMCPRWAESFMEFYRDMGDRPPGMSLDRIDNDGPYSRENCRWSTPAEQARNRRSTVLFRIGDREMSLTEWSKVSGIAEPRIWKRINKLGWPVERAVFEPIDEARSRRSRQ